MKHALPLVFLLTVGAVAAAAPRPPNVVFILADDLGWGDLGCYGNPYLKTPNIDRLAQEGVLFTQFYVNGSVCSPSRSAFMTGQFPARNKVHSAFSTPENNTAKAMPQFLDPHVPNVAATLKRAGYATAHIGKWHLGGDHSVKPPIAEYGFDFVGSGEGSAGANIIKDDPYYRANSSSRFVDEGLKFIAGRGDQPFYLQLWMLVPHATLNPTPEQMEPFKRYGNPDIPHRSARTVFYASVAELDRQVGRLMAELKQLGLADNTIVVFSSDNGPEEIFVQNAGHSGVGSPGPFRGRKRSLYEGGVRVPFIARWPGRFPAGRVDNTSVISGVDLLPTLCGLTGAPLPAGHQPDGEDVSGILRGQSRARATPLFWEWRYNILGHVANRSPQLALRDGDWKLLMNPDRSRVELYAIGREPMELDNVATQHADIVARLSEQLLAWHAKMPPGPADPDAGRNDYPWPGTSQQGAGGNPKKGKKAK